MQLYGALQRRGVRCWRDEKDLVPGERILDAVDQAIRTHDRVLLCCSESSLASWWVKDEIRKAHEKERELGREIIIPLDLDGALFSWEDGLAPDLRSRLAARFKGWINDASIFHDEVERLLEALRRSSE